MNEYQVFFYSEMPRDPCLQRGGPEGGVLAPALVRLLHSDSHSRKLLGSPSFVPGCQEEAWLVLRKRTCLIQR